MSEPKAKTCAVTALMAHTNHGKTYEAGDTYTVPEAEVENLVAQGLAKPSDEVEQDEANAKADAKAAAKADSDAKKHK